MCNGFAAKPQEREMREGGRERGREGGREGERAEAHLVEHMSRGRRAKSECP